MHLASLEEHSGMWHACQCVPSRGEGAIGGARKWRGEEGKAGRLAEAALASRTAPTTAMALPERQDLPRERQTHQQHHKGEEGAQQDEKRHQTATGPRERRLTRR